MLQNNENFSNQGEKTLLDSLTLEIDDLLFRLRKADKVIRRELNSLTQNNYLTLKKRSINPINEEKFKKILKQLTSQNLLVDEYVIYMLSNEKNSIFKLIEEYNNYLKKRQDETPQNNFKNLLDIDEKLVYYIRHLGAMTYHLNIHLSLLNIILKNASIVAESQQIDIIESCKIASKI